MKRFVLGGVVGAFAYFLWGAVSWMVLPWHNTTLKSLPEEQLIVDTLRVVVESPGVYFFPSDRKDGQPVDRDEWAQKYRKGPVGLMVYAPQGKEPMPPSIFAKALAGDLLVSFLVLAVLWLSRDRVQGIAKRTVLAAGLGLLSWAAVHFPYWNWFSFPTTYTAVQLADVLLGFAILGAAVAKFTPHKNS